MATDRRAQSIPNTESYLNTGAKQLTPVKATGNQDRRSQFSENQIQSEWFTAIEAAQYLGVSPNALRIMVFRGKLKAYKLGSRLRFYIDDLRSTPCLKGR